MNQEVLPDRIYALPQSVIDRLEKENEPWKLEFCKTIKLPSENCKIIHISELIEVLKSVGYDTSELAICLEPKSEMAKKDSRRTWSLVIREHPDPNISATVMKMWLSGELYADYLIYDPVQKILRNMISQEPKKAKNGKIGRSVIQFTPEGYVKAMKKSSPRGLPYLTVSNDSLKEERSLPEDAMFLGLDSADFMRITSDSPLGDAPIAQYTLELPDIDTIDNSELGTEPPRGWNSNNWEQAPDNAEIWIYWSKLIERTRDSRARSCAANIGAILDPRAKRYNILDRLLNVARFAEISLKRVEELIELGPRDRTDLERLKKEALIPETPLKCPVIL